MGGAGHTTPRPPAGRTTIGNRLAVAASRMRGDIPLVVLDALLAALTYFMLFQMRFDLDVPSKYWHRFAIFVPAVIVLTVLATGLWGGYGRTWQHASIDEARRIALAAVCVAVLNVPLFGLGNPNIPLLVLVLGPFVVMVLQGLVRFQSRLFAFRRNPIGADGSGLRVAVVGAGVTGAAAVREMQRSPHAGLVAVAMLDDDPRLHRRTMLGVPVLGGVDDLAAVARDRDVHQVLLAVSDNAEVARRVADQAAVLGLPVRVLPSTSAWVNGQGSLRDVRDLGIEDLLGREQVTLDPAPVRDLIHGRRVLVTGAGGSIGSVIARQVAALGPERLVLLDHDETHLHDASEGLQGRFETVLADVRDPIALDRIFSRVRPDIVFHAAAHKHVPILERHACEAVRTNVLGTVNVVDAARRVNATHFVAISTDKAADPSSVMGATKWLAEQVVLTRAPAGLRYCAVRFGNVAGSRGSVIPTFQRQIAAGGPVTVTDPRMTRWFMSIDEAVRLVLQAAATGADHAVLALQMGEQVNVYELAERMIRLVGRRPGSDIEILITGVRPGEKLAEEMIGPGETFVGDGPILGIEPVVMSPADLERALTRLASVVDALDDDAARATLAEFAAPAVGAPRPPAAD